MSRGKGQGVVEEHTVEHLANQETPLGLQGSIAAPAPHNAPGEAAAKNNKRKQAGSAEEPKRGPKITWRNNELAALLKDLPHGDADPNVEQTKRRKRSPPSHAVGRPLRGGGDDPTHGPCQTTASGPVHRMARVTQGHGVIARRALRRTLSPVDSQQRNLRHAADEASESTAGRGATRQGGRPRTGLGPIEGYRVHCEPPPVCMMDGKPYWVVEKILDHKTCEGVTCVLLRWEGYGRKDDSWEPVQNLAGMSDMLQTWLDEHGLDA